MNKIKFCAISIVNRTKNWLQIFSIYSPKFLINRNNQEKKLSNLLKAFIGCFVNKKIPKSNSLIIFEYLRNIDLYKYFLSQEVLIFGSNKEKIFSKKNSLNFMWSFPIESAVIIAKKYNFYFFLNIQIKWLLKLFKKYDRVVVFIYEDTQPFGATFAVIQKLLNLNNLKIICIQHGYFSKNKYKVPNDGAISEYNFVWDSNQIELIGCEPKNTFLIGPLFEHNYFNLINSPDIVFVGTGTQNAADSESEFGYYYKLVNFFFEVNNSLPNEIRDKTRYRPHPAEIADHMTMSFIKNIFNNIDITDKNFTLNNKRKIFIGYDSSLLFEAGYCGHLVAHVNISDISIPVFKIDISFNHDQVVNCVEWIKTKYYEKNSQFDECNDDKKISFMKALQQVLNKD
jgi:hypothetical protein